MGMPSMPELIIILVIVVLLFGAKKIPDLAQGLGKGIKNFKKAMSEDDKEENIEPKTTQKVEEASETKTKTTKSDTTK
jgi:sec-independent protein translocase protein TatA